MHTAIFAGTILAGHKEAAIEVPFDPAVRWKLPLTRLEAGRWGHRVTGRVNGTPFESAVVPRGSSFFLLLPPELGEAAGLAVGASVRIAIHPSENAPVVPPGSGRAPTPKRTRPRRGSTR